MTGRFLRNWLLDPVDLWGMAHRTPLDPPTPFDQSGKQILYHFYQRAGLFTTEQEVFSSRQRTDGRFTPDPERLWTLGDDLLGRMGQQACAFEVFSRVPSDQTLVGSVRKVLNLRHSLMLEAGKPHRLPSLRLWVIATGHPVNALKALGGEPMLGWPPGTYETVRGLHTGVIAVNQLPEQPFTLLLRLMGRGKTFDHAINELFELPPNSWERQMATTILSEQHLVTKPKPKLSPEWEAYLKKIEPIKKDFERRWQLVDAALDKGRKDGLAEGRRDGLAEGRKDGLAEGRKDGLQAGLQGALLDLYAARFGAVPDALREAIQHTQSESTLRSWIRVVGTGSQDEIARILLQG